MLCAVARQRPLLLLLDDLQWADAGSINLLFHLGKRIARSRILIAGAYRPEEVVAIQNPVQQSLSVAVTQTGGADLDLFLFDGPFDTASLPCLDGGGPSPSPMAVGACEPCGSPAPPSPVASSNGELSCRVALPGVGLSSSRRVMALLRPAVGHGG